MRRDTWVPPYEYMGRTESSAPTMGGKECAKWDVGDAVPTKRCMGTPPFAAVGTNWAEGHRME